MTRLWHRVADSPYSFLWYKTQGELQQLTITMYYVSHMKEVFNQRDLVTLINFSLSDHFRFPFSKYCSVLKSYREVFHLSMA